MKEILLHIEAIIFASPEGVTTNDLKYILFDAMGLEVNKSELLGMLDKVKEKYEQEEYALSLHEINHHYQFLTKSTYHETVNHLQAHRDKKKLSQSALETLAIIAYRQPITKLEMEQIRGVNCDYSVQRLLEKKLIQITGKADTIGKPLLYGTSEAFMHYFGINHVGDLPQLKDIIDAENSIGKTTE